jgi:SAM-dependent methyltransferase
LISKDLFGKALLDYYDYLQSGSKLKYFEKLITSTNISDEDDLPLPYLFRSYEEMPRVEQQALNLCYGKILDVGCGAASHSLWLQDKGFNVKAIDSSPGAVEVAKKRGVKNVVHKSLLQEVETFDTILLLMNGTGIFELYQKVQNYLIHLKTLLKPGGQIIIDSSDIAYMYEDENLEELCLTRYYGELDYFIRYKNEIEAPMTWLYLDFDALAEICNLVDIKCEKVFDGEHYDYLARLTHRTK